MRDYYWHLHHTQLFEEEAEPVRQRIEFIKRNKPKGEQSTRLRLLVIVKAQKLLRRLCKYQRDFQMAEQAIYNSHLHIGEISDAEMTVKHKELAVARKNYEAARKRAWPMIEALHKKECPNCPWDGRTIFPGKSLY